MSQKIKKDFDPRRYTGRWYQIADIPQPYAQGCVYQTADYDLYDSSNVKVYNQCFNKNRFFVRDITGNAYIPNPDKPAALIVSFPNVPVPEEPNYLVLKTDYCTYSLVGSSDKKTLYILSRTEKMNIDIYNMLVKKAHRMGYKTNDLVRSPNVICK